MYILTGTSLRTSTRSTWCTPLRVSCVPRTTDWRHGNVDDHGDVLYKRERTEGPFEDSRNLGVQLTRGETFQKD